MNRYLADSNTALDLATNDPAWHSWSQKTLATAMSEGEVLVNPIAYAEIAPAFATEAELEEWVEITGLKYVPLPKRPSGQPLKRINVTAKAGGARTSILPDFYIGAHAQVEGLTLMTRDTNRYRTYFPDVPLIVPA